MAPTRPAGTPLSSMCPAFRSAATETHNLMARGRLLKLTPWETSLTDLLLLNIAGHLPRHVMVERFDAAREAPTGADWQWWFRDHTGYAGMRVQAKRRNPLNGALDLKAKSPGPEPKEWQAQRLVTQADRDGLTAYYCFYSDRAPYGAAPDSTGPCPHGPVDPSQWGASLLLGWTVLRLVQRRYLKAETAAASAKPWWRLVCTGTAAGPVATVREFISDTALSELFTAYPGLELEHADQADINNLAANWRTLSNPPVGDEPPDDIVRAFEERSLSQAARARQANIALFDFGSPS